MPPESKKPETGLSTCTRRESRLKLISEAFLKISKMTMKKQHTQKTHVKDKSRGGRNPGHMDQQEEMRPIVIDPTPMC
jgi:hypothetical protein